MGQRERKRVGGRQKGAKQGAAGADVCVHVSEGRGRSRSDPPKAIPGPPRWTC